jgi:uncharacterized protein (DUF1684 family)
MTSSRNSVRAAVLLLLLVSAACARDSWPEPPAVDPAAYQKEYAAWRAERQETIASTLPIVGIWTLPEGETPFGADRSLPVTLPAAHAPARAGVFQRTGFDVIVVPAAGAPLRTAAGATVDSPTPLTFEEPLSIGAIRLELAAADDGRLWVSGFDAEHPAVKNPPPAQAYPLDPRWRVSARFDAFDAPRPMKVPDVRGGVMEFSAVGELVFRLEGEEARLTAFGFPDAPFFFVMFRDPTNQSTTYGGYRILRPAKVGAGEFTVMDFNLASNPPCAFSAYTVCPTPPRENRLEVAVEAGEKRLPAAQGWKPTS